MDMSEIRALEDAELALVTGGDDDEGEPPLDPEFYNCIKVPVYGGGTVYFCY